MMLRHPSYVILSMIWICVLATGVQCVKNDGEQNTFLDVLLERARRSDRITRATGDEAETTDDSDNSFLRIALPMRNHKATSGDKVHFKCKVETASNANLTFTWYKEDLLIDPNYDPRVTITKRPWGSRMRMIDLFTYDSGLYRCEASNGVKRVHTSAHLTVSFKKPPPPGKNDKPKIIYQYGKCEKYKGVACAQFLAGMNIYVDAFEKQSNMEAQITAALKQISDTRHVSEECQRYAVPAFCYFVFHPCHANASGDLVRGDGLCSEDCKILKHETCAREYAQRDGNHFMEQIFNTANCSLLKSSKTSECTKIGLPYSNADCYENDGQHYRGSANVAVSGRTCKSWPTYMANKNPELVGGHNFCRNPGHVMNQPWCYVNDARTKKEMCKLSMCSSTNILFIVLPCACALLVIAAIGVYCLCCRRKPTNVNATSNLKVPLLSNHVKVHQVQASSIRYESNIGDGLFGPVLKACLVNEPSFANGYPVAVKVLQENYSPTQLDLFNKELEIFSKIEHNNVACLKAASNQPRCMLFEFSDFPSLHDHLVMHSPANDVTKPPIDNNASHANFVSMSVQVAAGMEYLSTQNFVHRDLAARNVLMLNDGTLKISNLGVVLESNSSSYYKPTQSNQMLPIRWMAPESIHSWQFSDKSAVWSFGVLLWEMFSFGLQPYCGYSNHEVLDMISRRQLLTCPDQCPAKVYSLMHECWCAQPNQRPSFTEILMKLKGWQDSGVGISVKNMPLISSMTSPSPPPEYTTLPSGTNSPWKNVASSSERSFPSSHRSNYHPSDVSHASSRDDFRQMVPQHRYYPVDVVSDSTDVTQVPSDLGFPRENNDVIANRDT